DFAADHVKLALERQLVLQTRLAADEELTDRRHHLHRQGANRVRVYRYIAPAEEDLPLSLNELLDDRLAALTLVRFLRQEGHTNGVLAPMRQVDADTGAFVLEELVRHLQQHAGAVARAW